MKSAAEAEPPHLQRGKPLTGKPRKFAVVDGCGASCVDKM